MSLKRLDILLTQRGLVKSREEAQTLIRLGRVWKGQVRLEKPGTQVSDSEVITIKERPPFVSRGGEKLKHALTTFGKVPLDKNCLDIGSSTGGFTDCLLKNGAQKVYAVDVGKGQLDWNLRNDPRVFVLESYNARHITHQDIKALDESFSTIHWLTMDVSFISILKILPQVYKEFPSIRDWFLLFKPQFEVGSSHIQKGGVVRDAQIISQTLDHTIAAIEKLGMVKKHGPEPSPVAGKKKGNVEYLLHFSRSQEGQTHD